MINGSQKFNAKKPWNVTDKSALNAASSQCAKHILEDSLQDKMSANASVYSVWPNHISTSCHWREIHSEGEYEAAGWGGWERT